MSRSKVSDTINEIFGARQWAGPRPEFTDERKAAFLRQLATTGNKAHAAASVGQFASKIDYECKTDREFAAAVELAQQLHNDGIDEALLERGIEGIPASKFYKGEWYTDEKVREYSDALAALYAKRRNPAYRDRVQVDGLENSGVLVVPATVKDPQEWAKQFERSDVDEELIE